jgi:predicted CXXCH cytochrome family protein
VSPLTRQYELCFRCHGDGPDRGNAHVERQFPQTNTRQEFTFGDGSYHPVVNAGRNPSVPSLIDPYSETSMIYCTDCHNNNAGPGAGGDGPAGPHGSTYAPILERQLALTDGSPHSPSLYALCYKCHSYESILADESFSEHYRHVAEKQIACTTCHDPHGSESNTHLINFNVNYVSRSHDNNRMEFVDGGAQTGNCSLFCHGKDHVEQVYPAE